MKAGLIKVGLLLLLAGLSFGTVKLTQFSFQDIREMRQLERVPQTAVADALAGVVNIRATVKAGEKLLTSKLTQTPSVYYRYRHEVETRDSDGNTRWDTKEDWYKSTDFLLEDASGSIAVSVSEYAEGQIDWRLPEAKRTTQGKHRYTEWRIVPGDQVFTFAYLDNAFGSHQLTYQKPGNYSPIISLYDEYEARTAKGGGSILWLILAMVCLAGATYCLVWILNIHRLLVYLTLFSSAVFICLLHFGLWMIKDDAKAAIDYLEQQKQAANVKVRHWISDAGLSEDQLGDDTQLISDFDHLISSVNLPSKSSLITSANRLKKHLLESQKRIENQYSRFPYKQVFWLNGLKVPEIGFDPTASQLAAVTEKTDRIKGSKIEGVWVLPVAGVSALLFLVFAGFGLRSVKTKRLIESIPTSPCQGVVYGVTEVGGACELTADTALRSPLTGTESVWYHYKKEEKRGSGKNAKWVTIEDDTRFTHFACTDNSGTIDINAANAEVISSHSNTRTEGRYRHSEKLLKENDALYVLGFAGVSDDGGSLSVSAGEDTPFIISNKTEFEIMLSKARVGIALWSVAIICALSAVVILLAKGGGLAPTDFMLAALCSPLLLLLLMILLHYNDLVFLRQRTKRNFANILVSLKKRKDLLPALVEVVKGYQLHESNLHTQLTEARSALKNVSDKEDANAVSHYVDNEKALLRQLVAVAENYPDLKANETFGKLMQTITALENEVALMRAGYNDAVETYNARCESFPDNILAKMFGFETSALSHKI